MRDINKIIIHCSYTPSGMDIGVEEIDEWHRKKGWNGCGYHYVIRRDGTVETGRSTRLVGAHCLGHNEGSVGICLVGGMSDDEKPERNFTEEQYKSLRHAIGALRNGLGDLDLFGHYELDSNKECPCFDVNSWYEGEEDGVF